MSQLSIAALIFATSFASAALYISLVEHPARLGLADSPLLAQWRPSYKRALPIQSGLAIAGGAAGLAIGYLTTDWRWFAGSILLLANWPFTLFVIMPINKCLMATPVNEASSATRALLIRWGRLHDVRSVLGAATTLIFAWASITTG